MAIGSEEKDSNGAIRPETTQKTMRSNGMFRLSVNNMLDSFVVLMARSA